MHAANDTKRLEILEEPARDVLARFAADVDAGLSRPDKHLSCRYFYDDEGSRLFEEICALDEYYLWRAENEIFAKHAADIAALLPARAALVELGSGSATKTRRLIEAIVQRQGSLLYAPIDVSRAALEDSAASLLSGVQATRAASGASEGRQDGLAPPLTGSERTRAASGASEGRQDGLAPPLTGSERTRAASGASEGRQEGLAPPPTGVAGLSITAIAAEYEPGLDRARAAVPAPWAVAWLGSNIGNLDRAAASALLRRARTAGSALIVGIDLRKDRAILEAAYDDAKGVTARFNKNLLIRINRELGGTFDLDAFRHRARYDEVAGRIEMELISERAQSVEVAKLGRSFTFAAGEVVHTEDSYKYSIEEIGALAKTAGLETISMFTDGAGRFATVVFG